MRSLRPITSVRASPTSVSSVKVMLSDETMQRWLSNESSAGEEGGLHPPIEEFGNEIPKVHGRAIIEASIRGGGKWHIIRLFSTNDYLGLSAHTDVLQAVAQTVLSQGMGPRASALVAGYTHLVRPT
jgi:8-amino-7-oxononanoate synthase